MAFFRRKPKRRGKPWPPLKVLWAALKLWWRDLPAILRRGPVPPHGLDLVVGHQGRGKTLWMVWRLQQLAKTFGRRVEIATNFDWQGEDGRKPDHYIPNPEALVDLIMGRHADPRPLIVAIDEIATWWLCTKWQSIDEDVIGLVNQQRKRHLYMVATVQRPKRLAASIRETATFIWEPGLSLNKRLLECRRYMADLYWHWHEQTQGWGPKPDLLVNTCIVTTWAPVTDELRASYDTYQVIQRLLQREAEGTAKRAPAKRAPRKRTPSPTPA